MNRFLTLSFIAVSGAFSGCAHRTFEDGKGVKYSSIVIGTTQAIGEAVIPTANGPASVKGYSSDQAQIMSAVVDSAVTAAMRARQAQPQAKPEDR